MVQITLTAVMLYAVKLLTGGRILHKQQNCRTRKPKMAGILLVWACWGW